MLVIANDHWRIGILPGTGASLAFGRTRLADGAWYDVLRPTCTAGLKRYSQCSSYVLVPFCNRVRDGLLQFGDRTWQLRRNAGDGTAMHGAAHEFSWKVAEQSDTAATLAFCSAEVVGANFPWDFSARVTYALDGARFSVRTELANSSAEPFPAGFGHHPYFQRGVLDPEVSEVQVEVPCELSYPLQRAMAVGEPGPVPAHADYRRMRPLERPFVDVCLTGRLADRPVRLAWPASGVAVSLWADDVFSHTVVFVPRRKRYFAVEPVTHANDGFNLMAAGVSGHGVFVLGRGESRSGEFHLDVEVSAQERCAR